MNIETNRGHIGSTPVLPLLTAGAPIPSPAQRQLIHNNGYEKRLIMSGVAPTVDWTWAFQESIHP